MSQKKKLHMPSPFTKCKTKRLNSEQKKTIKGTFIAKVSVQNVYDETSEEGSWITESQTSITTGDDDVFKSKEAAVSEAEEIHSPTEIFRRSEKQPDDEWSLTHMREDSIASSTKGAEDDILPSPKRCSDSEETQSTSHRPAGPKIHPVSPYIDKMKDLLFLVPYDETNQTVIEYQDETGKESKISQKGSERHSKGIFDSTRIVDPEIGKTLPGRFEWGDLSPISSSTQSSQHASTKELESLMKRILSKELSGEIVMPEVQNKKSFRRAKFKHNVPKTIMEETPSRFSKEPPNLHSAIQSENITKPLLQDNEAEKICDTPKSSAIHKLPKRDIFLQRKPRSRATEEVTSKFGLFNNDSLEKSFSGKHISTTPQLLSRAYVVETKESEREPLLKTFSENADKSSGDSNQPKKTAESKLLEKKKFRKRKDSLNLLKEKNLSKHISRTRQLLDKTYVIETKESERSPIRNTFTENAGNSTGAAFIVNRDSNQPKKTAESKLLEKKEFHKTKASLDLLKEKNLSATQLSIPTGGIIHSESVQSSNVSSTKASKENAAKPPEEIVKNDGILSKKIAADKLLKRRKKKPYPTSAKDDGSVKKKRISAALLPMATEDTVPAELVESSKAPSTKISKENESECTEGPATLIEDSHKVKKTSATTLMKKILHKQKEKLLKKKKKHLSEIGFSSVSTQDSIVDFIAPDEPEESSEHSSKITERNSQIGTDLSDNEDSWKIPAASKMMKRKKICFKTREPLDEELEEEIVSTPSTTVTEDSVDYMDTSESESSNSASKISKRNVTTFLKEMGLYESEQSTEAEPSKIRKRKKNLKKRKSRKDSEEKSLEVRLQEYKDYLKTIPICDLSVKWRNKKEKHGDLMPKRK